MKTAIILSVLLVAIVAEKPGKTCTFGKDGLGQSYNLIGCYHDNNRKLGKVLDELIFTDRDRTDEKHIKGNKVGWSNMTVYSCDLICRCYQAAVSLGFTSFGIQYYGECWGGNLNPRLSCFKEGQGTNNTGYCILGGKCESCVYQVACMASMWGTCRKTCEEGENTDEQFGCPTKNPTCCVPKCGYHAEPAEHDTVPRIINGVDAGTWPWVAGLYDTQIGKRNVFCGAALINCRWLVTAAHCLVDGSSPEAANSSLEMKLELIKNGDIKLLLGTNSNQKAKKKLYGLRSAYIMRDSVGNPMFKYIGGGFRFDYDVMLLELRAPVVLNPKKIWPVCVDRENQDLELGKECYIAGWGASSAQIVHQGRCRKRYPFLLQEFVQPITSLDTCDVISVSPRQICIGPGADVSQRACKGDGGNSFNCKRGLRWYLTGAASLQFGFCCPGDKSAVFSKISNPAIRNWIEEMTGV